MNYHEAADSIVRQMLSVCGSDEQRERLHGLLSRHPFFVTDLGREKADDGTPALGLCVPEEGGQIYLSPRLVAYGGHGALGVYLHEACHAGAFSNEPILQHTQRFNSTLEQVMAGYGLEMSTEARDYNTRDIPERVAARQPGGLAMVAVLACIAGGVYAKLSDMPVALISAFLAAFLCVVADHLRRRRA